MNRVQDDGDCATLRHSCEQANRPIEPNLPWLSEVIDDEANQPHAQIAHEPKLDRQMQQGGKVGENDQCFWIHLLDKADVACRDGRQPILDAGPHGMRVLG